MLPIVSVISLILLAGTNVHAVTPAAISGDYVEVRSNLVYTCGCLFSGEQVTSGREAILAWAVRDGEYDGESLAGVKAVAIVKGPENLGFPQSARRSVVFVHAARQQAQNAMVAMLREYYGHVIGEVLSVEAVPISLDRDGERVTVNVRGLSRLVVRPSRLPQDAHPGSFLWYEPFIPVVESSLATAEYAKFSGPHFNHRWWVADSGITGYLGVFHLPR